MKPGIDRREFLRLAGLLSLGYAIPRVVRPFTSPAAPLTDQRADIANPTPGKMNLLVIVFDALTATNVSLYGYPRETMPNLSRLAERAVVYHNHFASGNFTSPGTASLLTGTLPWTHRAFTYNGKVDAPFVGRNIFHAFPDRYRIAYSHNPLVNTFFDQFRGDLDEYIPRQRLFLLNDGLIQSLFKRDEDIATVSWARTMKKEETGSAYSLFLSELYERYRENKIAGLEPLFPRGLPNISGDNYFTLETAIATLASRTGAIPQPFLGYFHFLPPHFPYKTSVDFYGRFEKDGWQPPGKPMDPFTQEKSPDNLLKWRTWYDEYLLYVDREFGRFFDDLESAGLLENTRVFLTSDHGELFERGISGHTTPVLYQPVVRIPLLIFEPGKQTRQDVYSPTSAVDVLPTLLHGAGQEIPDWIEGEVLPPYGEANTGPERSIYAVYARKNGQFAPLTQATIMLVKGRYKLVYFFGYEELGGNGEHVQLYDIESDPEELEDLSASQKGVTGELLSELKAKLDEVNQPYL
jgi:arylsulfatase A-like enzyme